MTVFLKVVLVITSLVLIVSVLMQSGRSAGLSGAIGGGAEQLFGKQRAQGYDKLFEKITKVSAALFILSALGIAILS